MFRVFATAQVLAVAREAIPMAKTGHRAEFHYQPKPGMIYIRSRAISSRCNDNHDMFPAGEIAAAYKTFVGKPVFVNHHNDDHKRMRGVIIDAALHRDVNPDGSPDTWAEVLMEVDGKTYPKLAKALLSGAIDRTSMGCDVKTSTCSICGNKATNPLEYCAHIPGKKGQRIYVLDPVTGQREGKLVFEICSGLSFFENSLLVEPPADPTALFLGQVEVGPGLEHLTSRAASRAPQLVQITTSQLDALRQAAAEPEPPVRQLVSGAPDRIQVAAKRATAISDDAYLAQQAQERVERRPAVLTDEYSLKGHLRDAHGFTEPEFSRGAHTDDGDPLEGRYHWADAHPLSHEELRAVHDHEHQTQGRDWPGSWTDEGLHAHAGLSAEGIGREKPTSQMNPEEYAQHQEKTSRDNAEGDAWNAKHKVAARHVVNHWNLATDDEKQNGMSWYKDAHELTKHVASDTHTPMHTMAGLMSNYSPQTHWATNIMTAAKVARTKEPLGGPGSGVFASSLQKKAAGKMLEGEHYDKVLGGPKTKAFAHLIEHGGNADPNDPKVVIDRHALSVAAGTRANDNAYSRARLGTKSRYNEVTQAYHKAAKAISKNEGQPVEAHQVQAVTWLVRQRLNEEHDRNLSATAGSRSATRAQSAIHEWNTYAGEHHPAAMGKEPGTGYSQSQPEDVQHVQRMKAEGLPIPKVASHRDALLLGDLRRSASIASPFREAMLHLGYGETKAPTNVDTLRDESCPVCGNDSAMDGRECQVCGYVFPPKVFGDPDVDKAKQLDTLKDDVNDQLDTVDPSRPGAPLGDDIDAEEAMLTGDDPANPSLECTNCGTGIRPAVPQTTTGNPDQLAQQGPAEGDVCPFCQKGQLASSGESPDDEDEDEKDPDDPSKNDPSVEDADDDTAIGDGKLPASKNARAQKYRQSPAQTQKEKSMRAALAALAEQQKLIDTQQRYIAQLMQGRVQQGEQIQKLTAAITVLASHAGPEVLGQMKVAMLRKHADEQNPASPVPEPAPEPPTQTTQEVKTPEAFADVRAPGMVPGSNNDVAADAISTAYTPGLDIPSPAINHLVDVTRPIDGTQGPRPINETKTEVDVRVGNPMNPQVAFPVGGPFSQTQRTSAVADSDLQLRTMASIRLARLQLSAGIAQGEDELSLGQTIASGDRSIQSIQDEIETITKMTRAASRQQQPTVAPRGVVPRSAGVARTVPSMASTASLSATAAAERDSDQTDIESIFLGGFGS